MEIGDVTPEKGMICTINERKPVIIRSISKNKEIITVQKFVVCKVKRSSDKPNGTIIPDDLNQKHKYKDNYILI